MKKSVLSHNETLELNFLKLNEEKFIVRLSVINAKKKYLIKMKKIADEN